MPEVGNKKFPYTKKGILKAKVYARTEGKPLEEAKNHKNESSLTSKEYRRRLGAIRDRHGAGSGEVKRYRDRQSSQPVSAFGEKAKKFLKKPKSNLYQDAAKRIRKSPF